MKQQHRVFWGVGILRWFGCSQCLHYLILQKLLCALGCEMLFSFIFLCYPWMYKENQKVISIETLFYFGHLLKLSGMCFKIRELCEGMKHRKNPCFILKWIVKLVFLCCCKLFAQVNADEHILYVRKKSIKKKKTTHTQNAWAFSNLSLQSVVWAACFFL